MGIELAKAYVNVRADMSGAHRDLKRGQGPMRASVANLASFAVGGLPTVLGVGIMRHVGAMFKENAINAGDFAETVSALEIVFGDNADTMKAWGDTTADAMGRTKKEVYGTVSGLQDLFVPMGVAEDEALTMSKNLTQLIGDLASFKNVPVDQAIMDIQSAMTGSTETMLKYGVILTGIDGKLSTTEKVAERYRRILDGTSKAHGNAVLTAGGFNNQIKALKADIMNVSVEMGTHFLPVLTDLILSLRGQMGAWKEWALTINKLVADAVSWGVHLATNWRATWEIMYTSAAISLLDTFNLFRNMWENLPQISLAAWDAIKVGFVGWVTFTANQLVRIVEMFRNHFAMIADIIVAAFTGQSITDTIRSAMQDQLDLVIANSVEAMQLSKNVSAAFHDGVKGIDLFESSEAAKRLKNDLTKQVDALTLLKGSAGKPGASSAAPTVYDAVTGGANAAAKSPQLAASRMSLESLGDKIQDKFLKGDDKQGRMIALLEQGNEIQKNLLQATKDGEQKVAGLA